MAVTVGLLGVVASLMTGCGTSSGPGTGQGHGVGVVQVVAAENFWGSITAQVGGSRADVISLVTNPNADPHSYEPTAADARAVAGAQVVIENGAGYDPWMNRLLAADGSHAEVLNVGDLVGVAPGGNPHLWYNPDYVTQFVEAVSTAIGRADPSVRAVVARQAATYQQVGLEAYHGQIAAIRTRFSGTAVGASESIVVYLCRALGLDLITPPTFLRAISEGGDVTAADIGTIEAQIRSRSLAAYLWNTQNSTPDVQAQVVLARSHGIPVVPFTETLQPAGTSFQAWQTAQLRALATALGAARGGARG